MRDAPLGEYKLHITPQPGFRPRNIELKLSLGEVKDLGEIRVELAGCDSPGTICDYFGGTPPPIASEGYINLGANPGVDLNNGKTSLPDPTKPETAAPGVDLTLRRDGQSWKLTPVNGALLFSTDCYSAKAPVSTIKASELEVLDELWAVGYFRFFVA